ncbi:MAG: hypothetical protein HY559_06000 [Gammaproteobacteria bacterium]|nr:hypothetical protein [Gammaproteobacteria bacterium]
MAPAPILAAPLAAKVEEAPAPASEPTAPAPVVAPVLAASVVPSSAPQNEVDAAYAEQAGHAPSPADRTAAKRTADNHRGKANQRLNKALPAFLAKKGEAELAELRAAITWAEQNGSHSDTLAPAKAVLAEADEKAEAAGEAAKKEAKVEAKAKAEAAERQAEAKAKAKAEAEQKTKVDRLARAKASREGLEGRIQEAEKVALDGSDEATKKLGGLRYQLEVAQGVEALAQAVVEGKVVAHRQGLSAAYQRAEAALKAANTALADAEDQAKATRHAAEALKEDDSVLAVRAEKRAAAVEEANGEAKAAKAKVAELGKLLAETLAVFEKAKDDVAQASGDEALTAETKPKAAEAKGKADAAAEAKGKAEAEAAEVDRKAIKATAKAVEAAKMAGARAEAVKAEAEVVKAKAAKAEAVRQLKAIGDRLQAAKAAVAKA